MKYVGITATPLLLHWVPVDVISRFAINLVAMSFCFYLCMVIVVLDE